MILWYLLLICVIREVEEPVVENEKNVDAEKLGDEEASDANKENPEKEAEEKEPEDKVIIKFLG